MFKVRVDIETLDDVSEDGWVCFGGKVFINGNLAHEVVPYSGTEKDIVHTELHDLLIQTIIKLGGEVWLDGKKV